MVETRVVLPNCLNWDPQDTEELVDLTIANIDKAPIVFDLDLVDFINPCGALLLLATSRFIAEKTGHKVRVENLQDKVSAYLERMDLFIEGDTWLFTEEEPTEKYSRSPASSHLIEITRLTTTGVRTQFQDRARKVLSTWLPTKTREINEIVTVLSEICGNAEEHSKDQGHAMIPCYHYQAFTEVDIVVIDLGIGINGSLSNHYHHLAKNDIDYINLALSGYSSRGKQLGGAGLQIVQKHVAKRKGEFALRWGSGLVVIGPDGEREGISTQNFPGTQVSLKLRG